MYQLEAIRADLPVAPHGGELEDYLCSMEDTVTLELGSLGDVGSGG